MTFVIDKPRHTFKGHRVFTRFSSFRGNFPTVHLIAVCISVFILSLTLLLLPSQPVSATKGTPLLESSTTVNELESIPVAVTATKAAANETASDAPISSSNTLSVSTDDHWVDYIIGSGDNLTTMFKKAGLTARDVYLAANAGREIKAFTRLFPGQTLSFLIKDGELYKLRHIHSALKTTWLYKTDNGFKVEEVLRQPTIKQQFAEGVIQDSLFLAGEEAGLSSKKIMELASIFGWDVDFVLDIRKNDSFSLIYEEHYLDEEKIGEGPIIAAQFINRGQKYTALRYTNPEGDSNYFTPEGYSMRKAFLRSPVDFARISSRFSLKRKHPVLNRIRAHKGVDYAARTGTPIKAAGDGKIIFRGRKGGYGNAVIVQHGGNITTLYAHMKSFKRNQRVGSKIKQGQVIGFVGQSGLASGPHLHYEFRLNGVHKNPLTVKLPHAKPIQKRDAEAFKDTASSLLAQLETYQATKLAALSTQ